MQLIEDQEMNRMYPGDIMQTCR